jgi:DNA-binding XRE family transcriptional regulator
MRTIAPGSPRLAAAKRFGDLLQEAMARRKVGQIPLSKAAKVGRSAVVQWRHGRNLPTLETARRLAEALSEPRLVTICREGRTMNCRRCGREFVHDGGGPRLYCGEMCLRAAQKLARPDINDDVNVPVDVRKRVRAAIVEISLAMDNLAEHQVSIALMCGACEPEGFCRDSRCPLRPVSPLPLRLEREREAELAVQLPGAWKGRNRERQLTAIREANAIRWATPGQREAHIELMKLRHKSMTEEQRQEWREKISVANKRAKAAPKEPAA